MLHCFVYNRCCCCCCRPHSTNVLPAESSTRIMWQPTVSPPQVAKKGSTLSGFVQRSRLGREVGRDLHSNKWEVWSCIRQSGQSGEGCRGSPIEFWYETWDVGANDAACTRSLCSIWSGSTNGIKLSLPTGKWAQLPFLGASRPLEPAEWLALLILKAGDVESNPGPKKIVYNRHPIHQLELNVIIFINALIAKSMRQPSNRFQDTH